MHQNNNNISYIGSCNAKIYSRCFPKKRFGKTTSIRSRLVAFFGNKFQWPNRFQIFFLGIAQSKVTRPVFCDLIVRDRIIFLTFHSRHNIIKIVWVCVVYVNDGTYNNKMCYPHKIKNFVQSFNIFILVFKNSSCSAE